MPRHPRIPSYRLHKPTDQAVITINGKDFYLGRRDSPKSQAAYKRLIAEWLANHQLASVLLQSNLEDRSIAPFGLA
jgi:hypothetical protein